MPGTPLTSTFAPSPAAVPAWITAALNSGDQGGLATLLRRRLDRSTAVALLIPVGVLYEILFLARPTMKKKLKVTATKNIHCVGGGRKPGTGEGRLLARRAGRCPGKHSPRRKAARSSSSGGLLRRRRKPSSGPASANWCAFAKKNAEKIDGLLVCKVNRAARNMSDYGKLEELESVHGIQHIAISQHTQDNPAGAWRRPCSPLWRRSSPNNWPSM